MNRRFSRSAAASEERHLFPGAILTYEPRGRFPGSGAPEHFPSVGFLAILPGFSCLTLIPPAHLTHFSLPGFGGRARLSWPAFSTSIRTSH